jgi:uncharacterized coiled-coil protein SlyX
VFAVGLNAAAAVYTQSPSDFALPDVSKLAALLPLPHEKPFTPVPEPVFAALKDVQSAQQQHAASLQESNSLSQQNAVRLEQDSTLLVSLRQSLTEEQSDVKKITVQLSTLISKVDSLQNAIAPEITSSIPKGRARNRLSGLARKRVAKPLKSAGPISVGGAPLTTTPAQVWTPVQSPEG